MSDFLFPTHFYLSRVPLGSVKGNLTNPRFGGRVVKNLGQSGELLLTVAAGD
jgi:hypothetical protein